MKQKYTWYAKTMKTVHFMLYVYRLNSEIPKTRQWRQVVKDDCAGDWLCWVLITMPQFPPRINSPTRPLSPQLLYIQRGVIWKLWAPELILTKDNWTPLLYTRATSNSYYNFYIVILLIKLATCDIVQHLKLMKTISNSKGNKVSRKV